MWFLKGRSSKGLSDRVVKKGHSYIRQQGSITGLRFGDTHELTGLVETGTFSVMRSRGKGDYQSRDSRTTNKGC